MATNRFQNNLSKEKIGTGKFFTKGSYTSLFRRGLAGALRKARVEGRHSYAQNLSLKDTMDIGELLGDEMKKLSPHSKGISRRAYARIMSKGRQKMLKGEWSSADLKDLRSSAKAVRAYTEKETDTVTPSTPKEPTKRATRFLTRKDQTDPISPLAEATQKHIRANIAIDNLREAEKDSPIKHDLRSNLGKLEQEENDFERKTLPKRNQKVNLPDLKDVIAQRDNLTTENKGKITELDIG